MIPVAMLVAMLLGGVALIGLGGAIYAGAFRAKEHVSSWESDREKRVSQLQVPLGAVLILFAIAGQAVNYATASWGGPW